MEQRDGKPSPWEATRRSRAERGLYTVSCVSGRVSTVGGQENARAGRAVGPPTDMAMRRRDRQGVNGISLALQSRAVRIKVEDEHDRHRPTWPQLQPMTCPSMLTFDRHSIHHSSTLDNAPCRPSSRHGWPCSPACLCISQTVPDIAAAQGHAVKQRLPHDHLANTIFTAGPLFISFASSSWRVPRAIRPGQDEVWPKSIPEPSPRVVFVIHQLQGAEKAHQVGSACRRPRGEPGSCRHVVLGPLLVWPASD